MTTETYNGWTNYATWNVNLWLSNDQGLSEITDEMAQDEYNRGGLANTYNLASRLEEFVRGMVELEEASMRSDMLGWALSSVNWHEIAEASMSDFEPDES